MKKQHSFWYGILFTCCTAFGVLLISSCEKEAPPVIEDPDPVVETELLADSIQDLAGYFNSEMEVFFIDPEYIDHILEYMGAFPTTDGRFGFSELNEEGLWMDYFFQVLPMPVPDIYFTALAVEMELESEGTEGNGVRYKVYKKRNAACRQQQKPVTAKIWQKSIRIRKQPLSKPSPRLIKSVRPPSSSPISAKKNCSLLAKPHTTMS
ncbi:MAG: hypothetical protein IPJ40_15240 [Saprospirales bacterium]|nr:hypothetical protein [Saprospirales bacterium]